MTRTKHEKLQDAKTEFRELMPLLRNLDSEEKRVLAHYLTNKSSEDRLLNKVTSKQELKRLAQMSEVENHALKNRYRH